MGTVPGHIRANNVNEPIYSYVFELVFLVDSIRFRLVYFNCMLSHFLKCPNYIIDLTSPLLSSQFEFLFYSYQISGTKLLNLKQQFISSLNRNQRTLRRNLHIQSGPKLTKGFELLITFLL